MTSDGQVESMESQERADAPRKVLLITESTYPFRFGGVSTWCHSLVRDLTDVQFYLISATGDADATPLFDMPPNVAELRTIPIWGARDALENRIGLTGRELRSRRRGTTDQLVESRLLPSLSALVTGFFADRVVPEDLGGHIHRMYSFFKEYDFDSAMRSESVWRTFISAARDGFASAAGRRGYDNAPLGLSDLVMGMHWLHHWLLPLAEPLPEVDVAHAAMAGVCTLIAVAAKLDQGAGFLLTEHGIYLRESYLAEAASNGSLFLKLLRLGFANRMTELSYALADQVSPCCDNHKRWEFRIGASPERVSTIYYGVDSTVFRPTHRADSEHPVVVWVGRIDPLKDVETLLRAAAIVKTSRPDVEFRLFGAAAPGTEDYYQHCMNVRRQLGLEDTVVLAGYTSEPQAAFNQGDLVVLSSISEGFPYSTLEAMLCAKPIVATAVGGIGEQIEGCGVLVEPRNPEQMAEAILDVMNDHTRRLAMGQAARVRAEELFHPGASKRAHLAAYERVARAGRWPLAPHPHGGDDAGPSSNGHETTTFTTTDSNGSGSFRVLLPNSNGHASPRPAGPTPHRAYGGHDLLVPGTRRRGGGPEKSAVVVESGDSYWATRTGHVGSQGQERHLVRTAEEPAARLAPAETDPPVKVHRVDHESGVRITRRRESRPPVGDLPWRPLAKPMDFLSTDHPSGGRPAESHDSKAHRPGVPGLRITQHRKDEAKPDAGGTDSVAALVKSVGAQVPHPVDVLEITAVLESLGITDPVAVRRFGAADSFELATDVYSALRADGTASDLKPHQTRPPKEPVKRVPNYLKCLPMIAPAAAVLVAVHLLATIPGWTSGASLALMFGVGAGMLLTNAFLQGVIRRGALYIGCDRWSAARRFLLLASGAAAFVVAVLVICAVLVSTAFGIGTRSELLVFVLCFVAPATLWLAAGGLVLVRASHMVGVAVLGGGVAGAATYLLLGPSMADRVVLTLTVGFVVSVALVVLAVWSTFRRQDPGKGPRPRLPAVAYVTYEAAPYFSYGGLLIIFLLVPQAAVWLSGRAAHGQINTISGVELGLTLALLPLIMAVPVAEHSLLLFWARSGDFLSSTPADRLGWFGEMLAGFHRRRLYFYLVHVAVLSLLSAGLFALCVRYGWLNPLGVHLNHNIEGSFAVSMGGYLLFGWGQFNCMFALALAKPFVAVRSVLIGVIVGLASTGVLILPSVRSGAALGVLVAASAAFAVASSIAVHRLYSKADFHYVTAM
jgi:glycosyltransferase involved in cell wall biosynthesis